ncbi:MAG: haloacid dehalogenase-like hydrolase [Cyanobacteria bacterium SZAS-4]|nr:haloacid dehalogenase-like hydrolase [Cyanobacteria bacterium SZAS-4]
MDTVAVIFDFDETLMPDSTSALLAKHGIDVEKFWTEQAKALIDVGYDQAHAYLRLILENVGPDKPLGNLTNKDLSKFGADLDCYYPGVTTMFEDLRQIVNAVSSDLRLEFYIISGGLQDLVQGTKIAKEFSAIYGCTLDEDVDGKCIKWVKRCITFTEKTRYLFEINKGIRPADVLNHHCAVNTSVAEDRRRIPFKNMIYVGDGLTDIPCFSLLKKHGGYGYGVFDPSQQKSAKKALEEFMRADRVLSVYPPDFQAMSGLGAMLRITVQTVANSIVLSQKRS